MNTTKYTKADISHLRWELLSRLGFIGSETVPHAGGGPTTDTNQWIKNGAPKFDFFWAPATDRAKTQIIVTLMGKHGTVGLSEDEDIFPSETLLTKLRLVLP